MISDDGLAMLNGIVGRDHDDVVVAA